MSFKLYNSFTKQKDHLDLPKDRPIKWYSCGPTVYDSAHIGHARTFLTFDIIRRVLTHYGHTINYVMNITDIDDKIINRVNENNHDYYQFVRKMEQEFFEDMDTLGITRPTVVTRVTEYIPKMIDYTQKILDNGLAYPNNGSVYFDSEAYEKRGLEYPPLKPVDNKDYSENNFLMEKNNVADFALWKKSKPGELSFDSPFGEGRVGWHLECSVMASDILGDTIDIHSGGIDLCFPHHTNEILQVNAYQNNKDHQWVKYFLHSGHLNIDGLKMSKSLKNFITIREYFDNIGSAQEMRLLFLLHKWHKPMDYNQDTIDQAKWTDKKLTDFMNHLVFVLKTKKLKTSFDQTDATYQQDIINIKEQIDTNLRDNINTPKVIKIILDFINRTYTYLDGDYNYTLVQGTYDYLLTITSMFGLTFVSKNTNENIDKWIELSIDLREDIRDILKSDRKNMDKETLSKFYNCLDNFRDVKLKDVGIKIEDKDGVTKWTKK